MYIAFLIDLIDLLVPSWSTIGSDNLVSKVCFPVRISKDVEADNE